MKSVAVVIMVFSFIIMSACSKDHEGLPTSFDYDPPPTPIDLEVIGGNEIASLKWSYPNDSFGSLKEFRIYIYDQVYDMMMQVGTSTDTFFVHSLLVGNLYYCYKVSAVDTTGLEGWRTSAECDTVKS